MFRTTNFWPFLFIWLLMAFSVSFVMVHMVPHASDSEGKFTWSQGEATFNFGKHKERSLREIAVDYPDYLEWMSRGDFSPEIKDIVIKALKGEFPELLASRSS